MKDNLNILVTATGGGGIGEQILKALQMSSLHLSIFKADCNPRILKQDTANRTILLPPASSPDYIEKLLEHCEQNNICAVFAGSEAELRILSANKDILDSHNIFSPTASPTLLNLCLDKCSLSQKLEKLGFALPRFFSITSSATLTNMLDSQPNWPFVFKPDGKNGASGGSVDVYLVQDKDEALLFGSWLLREYGAFMAQEYIGTQEQEFTVGVLHDMEGNLIGSIALQRDLSATLSKKLRTRNRTKRTDLGDFLVISSGISQGTFGAWPNLQATAEKMAQSLKACGPLNLQGRMVDGQFLLFEINPRFSGTSSLRAMAGFNEPELLIKRHILHQPNAPVSYQHYTIVRALEERILDIQGTTDA